jgi:hypothetical protein
VSRPIARPLRRLAPPRLLLVGGLVTLGFGLYALVVAARLGLGAWAGPEMAAYLPDVKPFLGNLLCVVAAAYGLGRLVKFHPAWQTAYARWLEQTPWHAGMPLPLGPASFAWRDVPVVAGVALLARFHAGIDPAVPLALMAFAYLVTAGLTFCGSKAPVHAALLAFGVPVMVLLMDRPDQALLASVPLLGVAWAGVRQSLARFPWKGEQAPTGLPTESSLRRESLGWPLDRLAPKPPAKSAPGVGWLSGAIVGWWAFVLLWRMNVSADPQVHRFLAGPLHTVVALAVAALAGARTLRYAMGYQWPISLTGRLLTGRLILPRYDLILLAPACIVALGLVAPTALARLGVGAEAAAALTLGLAIAATVHLGPSPRAWNLTGGYHMVRVTKNGAERQPGRDRGDGDE